MDFPNLNEGCLKLRIGKADVTACSNKEEQELDLVICMRSHNNVVAYLTVEEFIMLFIVIKPSHFRCVSILFAKGKIGKMCFLNCKIICDVLEKMKVL